MEVFGLGMATFITNFTIFTMIEVYSFLVPSIRDSLICFDKNALKAWGEYLKLGIPAAIMLCAEWWAFEILVILAGVLSVQE